MNNDHTSPAFKKLLQRLQEESWQLELLISGFAIFGLFSAISPLQVMFSEAQTDDNVIAAVILMVALISCVILIFNLLLHVILRGLWIGALGLRYVSGDIDYEYLNYSPLFSKYLKKKVGSFDRYIARLENYCSVIFAISFLLIFYVLAFIFAVACFGLIASYLINNESLGNWGRYIGIPLVIFFSIGTILVFTDFITQGWLKKKKWLSKIYFPFYWVFSIVTLSFLYRPLVYNFLDNKFGKRLSFLLVPIYILLFVLTSYTNKTSNYFNGNLISSDIIGNAADYEDLLDDEKDFIDNVVIPSKVITSPYLKVFMLFNDDIEDNVFDFNPELKPEKDIRGFSSDIVIINDISNREQDSMRRLYLKTLNEVYRTKIDSIEFDSHFIVTQTKKKQKGFETYLDLSNVKPGKHLFALTRKVKKEKDTMSFYVKRIPFWYFPNE